MSNGPVPAEDVGTTLSDELRNLLWNEQQVKEHVTILLESTILQILHTSFQGHHVEVSPEQYRIFERAMLSLRNGIQEVLTAIGRVYKRADLTEDVLARGIVEVVCGATQNIASEITSLAPEKGNFVDVVIHSALAEIALVLQQPFTMRNLEEGAVLQAMESQPADIEFDAANFLSVPETKNDDEEEDKKVIQLEFQPPQGNVWEQVTSEYADKLSPLPFSVSQWHPREILENNKLPQLRRHPKKSREMHKIWDRMLDEFLVNLEGKIDAEELKILRQNLEVNGAEFVFRIRTRAPTSSHVKNEIEAFMRSVSQKFPREAIQALLMSFCERIHRECEVIDYVPNRVPELIDGNNIHYIIDPSDEHWLNLADKTENGNRILGTDDHISNISFSSYVYEYLRKTFDMKEGSPCEKEVRRAIAELKEILKRIINCLNKNDPDRLNSYKEEIERESTFLARCFDVINNYKNSELPIAIVIELQNAARFVLASYVLKRTHISILFDPAIFHSDEIHLEFDSIFNHTAPKFFFDACQRIELLSQWKNSIVERMCAGFTFSEENVRDSFRQSLSNALAVPLAEFPDVIRSREQLDSIIGKLRRGVENMPLTVEENESTYTLPQLVKTYMKGQIDNLETDIRKRLPIKAHKDDMRRATTSVNDQNGIDLVKERSRLEEVRAFYSNAFESNYSAVLYPESEHEQLMKGAYMIHKIVKKKRWRSVGLKEKNPGGLIGHIYIVPADHEFIVKMIPGFAETLDGYFCIKDVSITEEWASILYTRGLLYFNAMSQLFVKHEKETGMSSREILNSDEDSSLILKEANLFGDRGGMIAADIVGTGNFSREVLKIIAQYKLRDKIDVLELIVNQPEEMLEIMARLDKFVTRRSPRSPEECSSRLGVYSQSLMWSLPVVDPSLYEAVGGDEFAHRLEDMYKKIGDLAFQRAAHLIHPKAAADSLHSVLNDPSQLEIAQRKLLCISENGVFIVLGKDEDIRLLNLKEGQRLTSDKRSDLAEALDLDEAKAWHAIAFPQVHFSEEPLHITGQEGCAALLDIFLPQKGYKTENETATVQQKKGITNEMFMQEIKAILSKVEIEGKRHFQRNRSELIQLMKMYHDAFRYAVKACPASIETTLDLYPLESFHFVFHDPTQRDPPPSPLETWVLKNLDRKLSPILARLKERLPSGLSAPPERKTITRRQMLSDLERKAEVVNLRVLDANSFFTVPRSPEEVKAATYTNLLPISSAIVHCKDPICKPEDLNPLKDAILDASKSSDNLAREVFKAWMRELSGMIQSYEKIISGEIENNLPTTLTCMLPLTVPMQVKSEDSIPTNEITTIPPVIGTSERFLLAIANTLSVVVPYNISALKKGVQNIFDGARKELPSLLGKDLSAIMPLLLKFRKFARTAIDQSAQDENPEHAFMGRLGWILDDFQTEFNGRLSSFLEEKIRAVFYRDEEQEGEEVAVTTSPSDIESSNSDPVTENRPISMKNLFQIYDIAPEQIPARVALGVANHIAAMMANLIANHEDSLSLEELQEQIAQCRLLLETIRSKYPSDIMEVQKNELNTSALVLFSNLLATHVHLPEVKLHNPLKEELGTEVSAWLELIANAQSDPELVEFLMEGAEGGILKFEAATSALQAARAQSKQREIENGIEQDSQIVLTHLQGLEELMENLLKEARNSDTEEDRKNSAKKLHQLKEFLHTIRGIYHSK